MDSLRGKGTFPTSMDTVAAGGRPIQNLRPITSIPPVFVPQYGNVPPYGNVPAVPVNQVWSYNPPFNCFPMYCPPEEVHRRVRQEMYLNATKQAQTFAVPQPYVAPFANGMFARENGDIKPFVGGNTDTFYQMGHQSVGNMGSNTNFMGTMGTHIQPGMPSNQVNHFDPRLNALINANRNKDMQHVNDSVNQVSNTSFNTSHLQVLRQIHEQTNTAEQVEKQGNLKPVTDCPSRTNFAAACSSSPSHIARMRTTPNGFPGFGGPVPKSAAFNDNVPCNSRMRYDRESSLNTARAPSLAFDFETNRCFDVKPLAAVASELPRKTEEVDWAQLIEQCERQRAATAGGRVCIPKTEPLFSKSNNNPLKIPKLEPGTEINEWVFDDLALGSQPPSLPRQGLNPENTNTVRIPESVEKSITNGSTQDKGASGTAECTISINCETENENPLCSTELVVPKKEIQNLASESTRNEENVDVPSDGQLLKASSQLLKPKSEDQCQATEIGGRIARASDQQCRANEATSVNAAVPEEQCQVTEPTTIGNAGPLEEQCQATEIITGANIGMSENEHQQNKTTNQTRIRTAANAEMSLEKSSSSVTTKLLVPLTEPESKTEDNRLNRCTTQSTASIEGGNSTTSHPMISSQIVKETKSTESLLGIQPSSSAWLDGLSVQQAERMFPFPKAEPSSSPAMQASQQQQKMQYTSNVKREREGSSGSNAIEIYDQDRIVTDLRLTVYKSLNRYRDLSLLEPDSASPTSSALQAEDEMSTRKRKRTIVVHGSAEEAETPTGEERERVRKSLRTFEAIRRHIINEDELLKDSGGGNRRPDTKAGTVMLDKGLWINRGRRIIGSVPGVHVGDIFFFRLELCVLGLHGPPQAGIDYVTGKLSGYNEDPIAISIISSGGYKDDEDEGETLIYTGEGGNNYVLDKRQQSFDQKLERGNLALERSMHYGVEIRVIRGLKDPKSPSGKIYIYDGLYKIEDSWLEKGALGTAVFKYKLKRIPGQPELGSEIFKKTRTWISFPLCRPSVHHPDLSLRAENYPVCVSNTFGKEIPFFTYITKVRYPYSLLQSLNLKAKICECSGGCANGPSCSCVETNGGQLPYSSSRVLVKWKPFIIECNSLCKCPSNCRNRVTQGGLTVHLDVFRTSDRSWGVMSWDAIPAGTFICEYVGEVLPIEGQSVLSSNERYVFDVHKSQMRWTEEWGNISDLLSEDMQGELVSAFDSLPALNFIIDARRYGNMSRFINHSATPNVIVQLVLYDHMDTRYPHVMLFARENIPPLTELTLDYGHDPPVIL